MAAPLHTPAPVDIAALDGNRRAMSFAAARHAAMGDAQMADSRESIARVGVRKR
jgi:hypothetical protein